MRLHGVKRSIPMENDVQFARGQHDPLNVLKWQRQKNV